MDTQMPAGGGSAYGGKKIFIAIFVIVAAALLWHFWLPIKNYLQKSPAIAELSNSNLAGEIKSLANDVSAPPPLKGSFGGGGALSQAGVLSWTNINRRQNGNLPPLRENAKLDQSAQIKLLDMFKQQYFEHINPQGKGPSDLAKEVNYQYIAIGENLALGNFDNDQALLTAWMNSPGHRANILDKKYQDIGVAVGEGDYQGHQTWLAVQEFGEPTSACPYVDPNLKAQITSLQSDLNLLQPQVESLKSQLQNSQPQTQAEYNAYNQLVAQYNALVQVYNQKVDFIKLATSQYNTQVNAYNACAGQ